MVSIIVIQLYSILFNDDNNKNNNSKKKIEQFYLTHK